MKILHVITSLINAGAENQLLSLISEDKVNTHIVLILRKHRSNIEFKFKLRGIKCINLNIKNLFDFFLKLKKLTLIIKNNNPELIQSWMMHAEFFVNISLLISGIKINHIITYHSPINFRLLNVYHLFLISINAIFSFKQRNIKIFSSETFRRMYVKFGYLNKNVHIIRFGQKKKKMSACNHNFFSLGMLARINKFKDHETLFRALEIINKDKKIQIKIFLAGEGLNSKNTNIINLIKRYNLLNCVVLLGDVNSANKFYRKIHLHILSSKSESYGQVIIESMAFGIPNISSDVGIARFALKGSGWIFPVGNYRKLADLIKQAYAEYYEFPGKWNLRRNLAQRTIQENFSFSETLHKYKNLWTKYQI
jgi:glycosyltransferase involved in cell wall biosynthesis